MPGPYFDFLVYPAGECWESRRGKQQYSVRKECFHHPNALRVQDSIVSVFIKSFEGASSQFNYYGPTEYREPELDDLRGLMNERIDTLNHCSDSGEIAASLGEYFKSFLYEDLHLWLPDWRQVRSELEFYGRQILYQAAVARHEQKSLLVLGI